jgi:uncharacterized membrane protein YccC
MIALTRFPPTRHAWRNMLLAVAGFGLFTLLFAYSNSPWSLLILALIWSSFAYSSTKKKLGLKS